jgi:hypothetical protein
MYLALVVYYLVYTENGARPSKQSVKFHDPHLGRVWAKQVTPPHTVASLKRCICEVEEISQSACIRGKLFDTTSSESPLSDGPISILTGDGPGSTPEEPIALFLTALDLTFNHRAQALCTWGEFILTFNIFFLLFVLVDQKSKYYPSRYLSLMENEILYTDGIIREDFIYDASELNSPACWKLPDSLPEFSPIAIATRMPKRAYQVISSRGKVGREWTY